MGGLDAVGNRTELKKSSIAGPDAGLYIKIYANVYEKLVDFYDILGLFILVGNSSYLSDLSANPIAVAPGYHTFININREFKSILSKPYSDCEIDNSNSASYSSEFYNLLSHSDYTYSQQLCFSLCLQKYFINKYNCTYFHLLSLYSSSQCDSNINDMIYSNEKIFDSNYIVSIGMQSKIL